MRGHEPYAKQAVDLLDRPHQRGQPTASAGISIVVDVLAEQHHLSRSVAYRLPALSENRLHRGVDLATPDPGNDAEGAVVVAALDDVDVVADSRPSGHRQRLALRSVVAGVQLTYEGGVATNGYHRVQVRKSSLEVVALFPHQAAGQCDRAARRLPGAELVELRVHLVLA